ncbi:MAG: hypothetical protein KatS3mg105_2637 [Gemmatales bacterium]|nr:MAG: hypothetical protein KatS3mg105_2637 [Gemmatales bacterium]
MNNIDRRKFLAGAVATAAATATAGAQPKKVRQEFYELRVYRLVASEKKKLLDTYLQAALIPALNRLGIDRVGVFNEMKPKQQPSVYVLVPYRDLDVLGELRDKLIEDREYQKAARPYLSLPATEAPYARIESRLMRAFAGMPVMELPPESKAKKPRMFEVRIYESRNEESARLKVEMFNEGEIQLMRDVKLGPVFYGETLISNDVPNLTYMLSAPDMKSHQEHWQAFRQSPIWQKMKNIPKYKDTVSKITSVYLLPAGYSQI